MRRQRRGKPREIFVGHKLIIMYAMFYMHVHRKAATYITISEMTRCSDTATQKATPGMNVHAWQGNEAEKDGEGIN